VLESCVFLIRLIEFVSAVRWKPVSRRCVRFLCILGCVGSCCILLRIVFLFVFDMVMFCFFVVSASVAWKCESKSKYGLVMVRRSVDCSMVANYLWWTAVFLKMCVKCGSSACRLSSVSLMSNTSTWSWSVVIVWRGWDLNL